MGGTAADNSQHRPLRALQCIHTMVATDNSDTRPGSAEEANKNAEECPWCKFMKAGPCGDVFQVRPRAPGTRGACCRTHPICPRAPGSPARLTPPIDVR